MQAFGSLESWARHQGAALTFTSRANELEVRVVDGLKGCDDLIDHLLDQVEQHHRRFLSAQIQHAVLVPEQGLGSERVRSTFAPSVGYEDGASRDSHGLRLSPAEKIRTNRAAKNKSWQEQLLLKRRSLFLRPSGLDSTIDYIQ